MDDGLKQRLVGAVVVVAIGVLFLPSLLNRDSRRSVDVSSQLTQQPPPVAFLDLPEPTPPENIPPAKPLEENYAQQEPAAELPQPSVQPQPQSPAQPQPSSEPPELNAEGVPNAWSLQVSSFQSAERAKALLERLQAEGFKAYVHEARVGEGTVHRVFVGPKINRAAAEAEKRSIDEKFQVNTLVVEFKP